PPEKKPPATLVDAITARALDGEFDPPPSPQTGNPAQVRPLQQGVLVTRHLPDLGNEKPRAALLISAMTHAIHTAQWPLAHEPARGVQRWRVRDRGDVACPRIARSSGLTGPHAHAPRRVAGVRRVPRELSHDRHHLGESPHTSRALPESGSAIPLPQSPTARRGAHRALPALTRESP